MSAGDNTTTRLEFGVDAQWHHAWLDSVSTEMAGLLRAKTARAKARPNGDSLSERLRRLRHRLSGE